MVGSARVEPALPGYAATHNESGSSPNPSLCEREGATALHYQLIHNTSCLRAFVRPPAA